MKPMYSTLTASMSFELIYLILKSLTLYRNAKSDHVSDVDLQYESRKMSMVNVESQIETSFET